MNAAIQALCSTELLKTYFDEGFVQWEINDENENGYKGKLVAHFRTNSQIKKVYHSGFQKNKDIQR